MTNVYVKAILDRPSPKSLGVLGLVTAREGEERLRTSSIVGAAAGSLDGADLESLVAGGHAILVPELSASSDQQTDFAALWIGEEFSVEAEALGLPLPHVPINASGKTDMGLFWIAPIRHAWLVWQSWIAQAFRKVARDRDERVARTLMRAAADRDEARAAVWFTSTAARRERDLQWWAKLEIARGRHNTTSESLTRRFESLIESASRRPAGVVGFCAPAKGGDNEIAEHLARRQNVMRMSFGGYLKGLAGRMGLAPSRRLLQRLGQQTLSEQGALSFCLQLLDVPDQDVTATSLVIDGIRHKSVLETLVRLLGQDRFTLAYVHRQVESRRRLLMEDENLNADTVEEVLQDPTEVEIPEVQEHAKVAVNADGNLELETERLVASFAD